MTQQCQIAEGSQLSVVIRLQSTLHTNIDAEGFYNTESKKVQKNATQESAANLLMRGQQYNCQG